MFFFSRYLFNNMISPKIMKSINHEIHHVHNWTWVIKLYYNTIYMRVATTIKMVQTTD